MITKPANHYDIETKTKLYTKRNRVRTYIAYRATRNDEPINEWTTLGACDRLITERKKIDQLIAEEPTPIDPVILLFRAITKVNHS